MWHNLVANAAFANASLGTLIQPPKRGLMKALDFADLDLNVSRARIALSLVALVSIYIDPTTGRGIFTIDSYALATLALHFAYGMTAYSLIRRRIAPEQ